MWFLLAFTGVLGIISVLAFYFMKFSKQTKVIDSASVQKKICFIRKIVPACHAKGWNLLTVDNGLRVWKREIVSKDSWYSGIAYGCSGLIPASLEEIMNSVRDLRCITEWDPCVRQVSKVSVSTNHDVVSVSPAISGTVENWMEKLMHLYGGDTNNIYSRYWHTDENVDGWFFTSSVQQTFSSSGLLWSSVTILPITKDESNELAECLVTIVAAPASPGIKISDARMLTSARIAGLKDFFTNKAPVINIRPCPNGELPKKRSAEELFEIDQDSTDSGSSGNVSASLGGYQEQEVGEFTHVFMSDTEKKISNDFKIKEILEVALKAYGGKIGTDGWSLIGNIKDVEISKRLSQPGEKPFDTLKGVGLVNVPIHYILAYSFNLEYRAQWDDMFLKGKVLKPLDGLTRIVWMEYKAVWPTSGRDFVNLVALREVEEGLYVVAAAAAASDDDPYPPKKGLVRGETLCVGFFVREVTSDPPCCQVTYVSRVDLKGNLPPRLVNRVTQSQPQAIAVLREKLEAIYNEEKEKAKDKEEMSKLQKQGVDLWMELMKMKEMRGKGQQGSHLEKSPKLYKKMLESADSLDSRSTTEENVVKDVSPENELKEEYQSVELSGAQINGSSMNLPFVDGHHIDYKTLGNQIAATLTGEVIMASKVEISMFEDPSQQIRKEGEWSYQSIEKEVVILRKINPGEKIHSFLGKGMIKCSPISVWNAVKNHMTRHVYDKTLKKTKIIKQLDESSKLMYLHHETAQCFVKQARDFVVLTVERTEPERYVLAGVSVDTPESPPVKDLIRGKVYASGWVIEPVLQDGQLYSMVSYLSQIDFGGVVPVRLINHIARRQPLCVSYLREYLEKFKE